MGALGGGAGPVGAHTDALAAVRADDLAGALTALRDGWRAERRCSRTARLVRAVGGALHEAAPRGPLPEGRAGAAHEAWLAVAAADDAGDVERLLAALTAGTVAQACARFDALPDDPRVVAAGLALLEQPPYSSKSAMPMWAIAARAARGRRRSGAGGGPRGAGGRLRQADPHLGGRVAGEADPRRGGADPIAARRASSRARAARGSRPRRPRAALPRAPRRVRFAPIPTHRSRTAWSRRSGPIRDRTVRGGCCRTS